MDDYKFNSGMAAKEKGKSSVKAEETAHAEDSVRELWYSKEPNKFTLDAAALGEEGAGVGARGKGEEVNWSQNQGAL